MTNISADLIRVGVDMASTDIRVAGAIVAAGLVLGAAGVLWSKWREGKK